MISINTIREPVKADLEAADKLIVRELLSKVTLIQTITQHIIKSGGKRLRPLLVILSARALGFSGDTEHLELATIIEFVHTATLLHDDVVDESKMRRGKETANAIWGNQASVLVGDFLYSRAFQLLTHRGNVAVMKALADTTNAIAEGEVLQLMNQGNASLSEEGYFDVIYRKTAKLFESAAEIGAIIATPDRQLQKAMADYGHHLGMAFQIIDDVLDYVADSKKTGKNIGDDLAEGKTTLPVIYALSQANNKDAELIIDAIENCRSENIHGIVAIIKKTNAIDYAMMCAKQQAEIAREALHAVANNPFKQAMLQLIDFAVEREY